VKPVTTTTPILFQHGSNKGSALLLVMWALLFMSLTVLGVIEFVTYGLDESVTAQKDFRARQLAESGLALGFHPRVHPGDPILTQDISDDESINVTIQVEDGRMPINAILKNEWTDTLHDLFLQWGLEEQDISVVIDSLSDWVDGDNDVRINGAENDYYTEQGHPDYPRNKPFQSLNEMRVVRGMDKLEAVRPDWRDYFTVYGSGLLNMNGASADAIQGVAGATQQQAEDFVQLRDGPDGLPNTDDDIHFKSLDEVRDALGLSTDEFNTSASRLTVDTTILRVESQGRAGNCTRVITVIAAVIKGKRPVPLATSEDIPLPNE